MPVLDVYNDRMEVDCEGYTEKPTILPGDDDSVISETKMVHSSDEEMEEEHGEERTMIFFDWDDTLLPATFLADRGYRLDSDCRDPITEKHLFVLSKVIEGVLRTAMQFGIVHIVTNAEETWVERSCEKFLPGVYHLLQDVRIISARSRYEFDNPDSPLKWKVRAFQDVFESVLNGKRNVVSFGDSNVERLAIKTVTKALPLTRTKSVKFCERPTLEQLKRQLELITNCFQYICHHEQDLDLMLTIEMVYPNCN